MGNMRGRILSLVALLAVATALFTVAGAPQVRAAPDLSGVWDSTEGGKWYITQIGNTFWMYGEGSDTNPGWATVAHGFITDDNIKGTYSTVPKGRAVENGKLNTKIISDNELYLRKGLTLYR